MSSPAAARPPLVRTRDQRLIAGVCVAIARHLRVDPLVVRLVMVLLTIAFGGGLVAYALGWIFIPQGEAPPEPPQTRTPRWAKWPESLPDWFGLRGRDLPSWLVLLVGAVIIFLVFRVGLGNNFPVLGPLVIVAGGVALIWRQIDDRDLLSPRSRRVRLFTGAAVAVFGLVAMLTTLNLLSVTWQSFVSTIVILGCVALATAPGWRRLVAERTAEHRQRVRVEARAEMAAHLHDSVLQTLALIQRHADSTTEVTRLARSQERELRRWLFGRSDTDRRTFTAAIELAVADIEGDYDVRVSSVVVGEAAVDEHLEALLQATHEAMRNAARHSGQNELSLYAEIEGDEVTVFVRDRGAGFDPDRIAEDRRGVRDSILGRVVRHGGTASIRSTPGNGTEVALRMRLPRSGIRDQRADEAEPADQRDGKVPTA